MIRVLRPAGAAGLISSRAFDDTFCESLAPDVSVEAVELDGWLRSIFGDRFDRDDRSVDAAWRSATNGYAFLCPNHRAIPLSPLLAYTRNRSGAPIRLLLIAHAPGTYALEWALLRPLLRRGDVIIAPTESAARVIAFLVPELADYVCSIPHPIRPLTRAGAQERKYISTLGRLHPCKLLHRQIEAMSLLRERTRRGIRMRIAGPLHEPGARAASPYSKSLAAKIRRLGLEQAVELVGEISCREHKQQFLSETRLLLNLSISIEESFGKSIAEALGAGVPVLATEWDGFPETIGAGGRCITVTATPLGMDVSPQQIADALEALVDDPPDRATCRREAVRFLPRVIRRRYRDVLESAAASTDRTVDSRGAPARDLPASPSSGLLGHTAPLGEYSWTELFELHLADAVWLRAGLPGTQRRAPSPADALRGLVLQGIQAPVSRLLAGVDMHGTDRATIGARAPATGKDLFGRAAAAAMSGATLGSRLACLAFLARAGRVESLRHGLDAIKAEGFRNAGIAYFEIEALRLEGKHQAAFVLSTTEENPSFWGELAADRVRQLAAVCRDWGLPGMALPWIRDWLERFPDSPESAALHLDRSANAAALGPDFVAEATVALNAARDLLDDSVHLDEIELSIQRAGEPPWSAIAEKLGPVTDVVPVGRSRSTFIVSTDRGKRVVKRMPPDRAADRYFDALTRLSQDSARFCPRPLATVDDGSCWYALFEWIDGRPATSASTPADVSGSAVRLLERMQRCAVVPDWPLESLWLERLQRHLSDDAAAAFVLEWLRRTSTIGGRTLAHGDFSLQNFVWGSDGLMLVDWEELGSAPSGFDAGWLLAHARIGAWPRPRDLLFAQLVDAGFDRSNLQWFETLGLLRLLYRARHLPIEPGRRGPILTALQRAVDAHAATIGWRN